MWQCKRLHAAHTIKHWTNRFRPLPVTIRKNRSLYEICAAQYMRCWWGWGCASSNDCTPKVTFTFYTFLHSSYIPSLTYAHTHARQRSQPFGVTTHYIPQSLFLSCMPRKNIYFCNAGTDCPRRRTCILCFSCRVRISCPYHPLQAYTCVKRFKLFKPNPPQTHLPILFFALRFDAFIPRWLPALRINFRIYTTRTNKSTPVKCRSWTHRPAYHTSVF